MNADVQRPISPRPLASSLPIVDEASGLTAHLAPFPPDSQPFAAFRAIGNIETEHSLQSATQAQDAIVLGSNASDTTNNEIVLLQSAHPSFQQPNYGSLAPATESTNFAGQLQGMRLVPDPPDLDYWRQKLFDVDEAITLSEEQYVIF